MKRVWILISLFILAVSAKLSIFNTSIDIETINGRVDGWINYDVIYNHELINMINSESIEGIAKDKIGIYIFNPIETSYEEKLDAIAYHGAKSAILKSLVNPLTVDPPGNAFYNTDSTGTHRFDIPIVEMDQTNFDMLIGMLNSTSKTFGNLTFTEKNLYIEFDRSFGQHLVSIIHILWTILNFVLCMIKLYQFDFFSTSMIKNIKNEKYMLPYLCLGLTSISTILKFINAININNVNLLYDFRSSRVLYTLHLLFFIISHMLLGLWAFRILILAKSLKASSKFFGKKTVITFVFLCILLVVLEFISDTGTFTFAQGNPLWTFYVIGIYVIYDIGMIGLYTYSNISILLMIRTNSNRALNRTAKRLIIKLFFTILGMFIWLIMLILQFPSYYFIAKRYTGLFGFYGINISETSLILSYDKRLKDGIRSTTKSTHKNFGSHNETSITLVKTKDKSSSVGSSFSLDYSPGSKKSSDQGGPLIHDKLANKDKYDSSSSSQKRTSSHSDHTVISMNKKDHMTNSSSQSDTLSQSDHIKNP
uniref:Uncharacterized protein n=1 Tax=Pithovirus LCPAC101 TaxID=2506586 RepID=A0A481Z263_9VIRU|nr:MAG: hypothetical protein LCPAC101_01100 [Pithovirus LCPAC101]